MRTFTIAGLAAAACLASGAQAQQPPDYPTSSYGYYGPGQPDDQYQAPPADAGAYDQAPAANAEAYRDYNQSYQAYNQSMSDYEAARDRAAAQNDTYNRQVADYRDRQRAYRWRLQRYYAARDAYDAEYGPGAYEDYYSPPPPPPN